MGGWPLLAASMAGHCPGQAAATCWAATVSSARMGLATPDGCLSSPSTAGARRRYQRSVPCVMARTAARSGALTREERAASAEWPHLITSSTARAAAASAGAPGAQGVLAKLPPGEGHTVRVIAYAEPAAPGPLHFGHPQAAAAAAHAHEIIMYGDDRPRIGAFTARLSLGRQDAQRL